METTDYSHHDGPGRFRNPWPGTSPRGFFDLLKWFVRRRTTDRPPPDPDPSVFATSQPEFGKVTRPGGLAVTWIGHSTTVIELHGSTVLTDPIWSDFPAP